MSLKNIRKVQYALYNRVKASIICRIVKRQKLISQ